MDILGVRVDDVTLDDTLVRVRAFVHEHTFHQIATVNPEFVVIAQTHPEFRQVLGQTALNVPDGVGLLWAARRLGYPLAERVTGQELVDRIAECGSEYGWGLFFLGAREGIAERAAAELVRRHPGLWVAGCYAGSPAHEEEEEIVKRIQRSGAQVLLVAYGPPNQELWIARNATRLSVAVALGVGGTFDTLAGLVPRAPSWMQRAGLEWAYRLIREPRRLKRQVAIPYFMWLVTREEMKRALRKG